MNTNKHPLFYPPLSDRAKLMLNFIALLILFTVFNIWFVVKYPTAFRREKSPAMIAREINDAVHIDQEYGKYVVHEDFLGSAETFDTLEEAEHYRDGYLKLTAQCIFNMRHAREQEAAYLAQQAQANAAR